MTAKQRIEEAKKNKKPYSSKTITTGDIGYNIDKFNKRMGSNDNNNPSTAEAQKAAEQAAAKAGTFASASPDGGSSVSMGGEGGGMGESLKINEEQMLIGKQGDMIDLPPWVHLIPQSQVELALKELKPEERFEVGYITPICFYKELSDKFKLLKCTQLKGYTGIDYIEARTGNAETLDARLQNAQAQIDRDGAGGMHANRQPDFGRADFSADYVKGGTNKLVDQNKDFDNEGQKMSTILFYPEIGTRPQVTYYLDLLDGNGYAQYTGEEIEEVIMSYLEDLLHGRVKLATYTPDGKVKDVRWTPEMLRIKIEKEITSSRATIEAITFDPSKDVFDTRSSFDSGNYYDKPPVRALYTSQIYYLKTSHGVLGARLMENLENSEDWWNIF